MQCLFKEISHQVIYTDADFKSIGDSLGYSFAQVPYHRGKKFIIPFLLGKIPEWRGLYSSKWFLRNIDQDFSILVNKGPGSFSSLRSALSVAKGIIISKKAKLFGFNDSDLSQFSLENIEILINKSLIDKDRIKLLYSG